MGMASRQGQGIPWQLLHLLLSSSVRLSMCTAVNVHTQTTGPGHTQLMTAAACRKWQLLSTYISQGMPNARQVVNSTGTPLQNQTH